MEKDRRGKVVEEVTEGCSAEVIPMSEVVTEDATAGCSTAVASMSGEGERGADWRTASWRPNGLMISVWRPNGLIMTSVSGDAVDDGAE